MLNERLRPSTETAPKIEKLKNLKIEKLQAGDEEKL